MRTARSTMKAANSAMTSPAIRGTEVSSMGYSRGYTSAVVPLISSTSTVAPAGITRVWS